MTQLLQNALYGAVMILAAAVLRGTLKDRLIPEARLALWAVCLFRLFTPAAPASALSFWGLFGGAREVSAPGPGPAAAPNAGLFVPAAPVGTAPAAPAEAGVPWGKVLAAVWIAVGAVLAARYALDYARTCRAVRRTAPLGREDARYAALPKCARLREGPLDGAPLTFGVVRPTVVLTPGLDGAELACVLAHEGVHARRRDNLWHYAIAAALTVFWWNPAVWLMARLMRRDVELSCDRAAVRRLGEGRRAEYANALVSMATQGKDPSFCQTFGRKAAEERIISVMKYKKTTVIGAALTLALVLAVTVGFASNPAKDMPDEESTTSSAPASAYEFIASADGELKKFSIGLDYLKELLADHVADGSMTEKDAAFYQAAAEAASRDGVTLERVFSEASGLFVDRERRGSGFTVYYLDENGKEVDLDLVEMLTAYVFAVSDAPSSSGLFVDSAEAEAGFIEFEFDDLDSALEEYKAVLVRAVAQGERTQAEADEMLARMKALIERAKNREIESLTFDKKGNGEVSFVEKLDEPAPICIRADCGNTGVHEHDGVMYKGWRGKYSAPAPSICTREDCPIQPSIHYHNGDGRVVYAYNDLPAYVEVCPVEGCTVLGSHIHDGHDNTIYLCSGAGHEGGVCDGSCFYFNGGMAGIYQENGYPVDENGYGLVYGEDGELFMRARWGYLPCVRTDCAIVGPHWHENGEVIHFYYAYDGPVACPPEAIDKDFYQKYPEAAYQDFEHHESGHHSDGHH